MIQLLAKWEREDFADTIPQFERVRRWRVRYYLKRYGESYPASKIALMARRAMK